MTHSPAPFTFANRGAAHRARHGAGSSRGGQFATQQADEAAIGAGGIDLVADGPGSGLAPVPVEAAAEPEAALTDRGKEVAAFAPYGYRHVGSRYDNQDVAEIAKALRSEIKQMQRDNQIPADWKVSVRTSRYSMGQSLSIAITGDIETEEIYLADYNMTRDRPVASAALAAARIENAMESYNYDRSDSQQDYYDVHFAGSVSINDHGSRYWSHNLCTECVNYSEDCVC